MFKLKNKRLFIKIFDYLENNNYPSVYSIIVFLTAIAIRNVLEIFAVYLYVKNNHFPYFRGNPATLYPEVILHYCISYIAMLFIFLTIFKILTKENIYKLLKIICPFFFMLLAAQMLDILICGGSYLAYYTPGYHGDLIKRFFTFFGEWESSGGVTPGIKTEIIAAMILSSFYVYHKTSNVFKTILGIISIYLLIFFYALTPFIIKVIFKLINISYTDSNEMYIYYFSILSLISGILLLSLELKSKLFKLRLNWFFYIILLILFSIIARRLIQNEIINSDLFCKILFAYISLFFLTLYLSGKSVFITNNAVKVCSAVLCLFFAALSGVRFAGLVFIVLSVDSFIKIYFQKIRISK